MGSKKILVFAIIFTVLSVIFGIVSIVVLIHPSDAYSYIDELVYNEGIIAKKIEYSGTYSDIYIENSDVCLSVLHQTVENQSAFDRLQSGDKIIFGLDKEGQDKFENGEKPSGFVMTLSTDKEEIISVDAWGKMFEDTEKNGKILVLCADVVFIVISVIFYMLWLRNKRKYQLN